MVKKKVVRWFTSGEPLGWRHSDSQTKRRRVALASRGGDLLAAGRALQALSNVNKQRNPGVARKARADAQYFFAKYRAKKAR